MLISEIINFPFLLILLPIVAFLYASVGHGGASGYLALMSLFAFPITFMKPTALLLNIFVSLISFYFYYREKEFKWKLFYPFAITSIPFSFLGGYLSITSTTYKIILGAFLFFAILRLLGFLGKEENEITPINLKYALLIGAIIGFFSGLIGIGGGIILSPLLLVLNWATIKQAAAVSALFIFVNSFSGIVGYMIKGNNIPESSLILISIVLIGGVFGGYYGSKKFNTTLLKNVLAIVLALAIFKLYNV